MAVISQDYLVKYLILRKLIKLIKKRDKHLVALALLLISLKTFNDQCPSHIEASELIWSANQLTGFYKNGSMHYG